MVNELEIIKRKQEKVPVPVISIANELGIRVWETKSFPDFVSGKLVKNEKYAGKSGYAIIVNGTHPETRRRFTIAHEIGHYVLHRNRIGDGIADDEFYRSALGGKLETEANQFAADLLMPFQAIRKLQLEGVTDLSELARRLKVSKQALSVRLGIPISVFDV